MDSRVAAAVGPDGARFVTTRSAASRGGVALFPPEAEPLPYLADRTVQSVEAALQPVERRFQDTPERFTVRGAHGPPDRADAHDERQNRAHHGGDGGNQRDCYRVAHVALRRPSSVSGTRRSVPSDSQLGPKVRRCRSSVAVAAAIGVPQVRDAH
jgi:hypothetical protein